MIDKKQTGGLGEDNEDLLQPGDQELNTNNLINTVENQKPIRTAGAGGMDILRNMQDVGFSSSGASTNTIDKGEWDEYNRLIDHKFSLLDSTIDDQRSDGQGFGEKATSGLLKFFPKTGAHVLGSTYGLLDGLGEVVSDVYENGFAASNWNKFFNNDFQRSLDDFNTSLDKKLPHYYSSQEKDLSFGQSVFGKGAANFWTNDFSNGLSFVAGAVISEYATAGMANALIPARAANLLKRVSAVRSTTYGAKAIKASKNLQTINRAERVYDGLTTGRRLLTGAFYESGVEARHNYDATVEKLNEIYIERGEGPPSEEEQAKIKNIAVKVSNGVFAGNAALVGYSNMLMFRKMFGSGLSKNKNFKNKIVKDPKTGVHKARHKDWGKMRSWTHRNIYGKGAWGRLAAYEGFVEEGGQKTLDISGQYAAEDMYLKDKNPSQLTAIGEILNNTFTGMGEAYGSVEGQKEIFLGVVLAALGLPSFIQTNEKGEKSFGIGYGKTGGIKDFLSQYAEGQKEVEDLVEYMNNNPDAMTGMKNNFDMLMGIKTADDERDYADATNNDFAYKNADHDQFFAFVHSRLKGGYFGDVMDSIEDMRDMDLTTFETMFNYEEQTQDMSKEDREAFLSERKNTVIETHKDRANKIKEIYDSLDNTKLSDPAKKMMAQALSSTADLDAREQKLINELEETGGFSLTAIVNKEENDKQSNDNILTRVKNFTMKKLGIKAKDVMENSEVGKEIKREIGIKEFTEPGHPYLVFERMMARLQQMKKQRDAYEQDDNVEGYVEIDDEIEALENEMGVLVEAMNKGIAPDVSEEEQQILNEYKQRDPAGYELNKEEMLKKLQDLRKIRAKRHQMLNLVQQMIDPDAANDKIQQLEQVAQDMLTEEERKNLPPEEQRLSRKYKGKILEFDYTNKKGETKTHRVYFKDSDNLVRLPNEETFKLLQRKKALLDKTAQTEDDAVELELINEELTKNEHVTEYSKPFTVNILKQSTNIKVLTEQELLLKQIQAVTAVLEDNLAEKLTSAINDISESKSKIIDVARQIKDIKAAIQQAKKDKNGSLYVNLNRIGRKGNFSVQSAYKLIQDLKAEEANYALQLKQFTQDIQTLEDNSLRIQLIHTALTNPEIVSELLEKSASKQDVFEFVNEMLGLTSIEEFYKNLGEKGFFDTNELTAIAGQKNKDGGYDVDNELLQEILGLSQTNISKEYLDLMSTDLEHFKSELELLTKHRSDVERMLSKMINPHTGEVIMFPEEGLTEDDLLYLTSELSMVDRDIKTLQGIVNMMEAETEQNFLDAANSQVIQERLKAISIQSQINDKFIEFENWLNSVTMEPAEQATTEDGEVILTEEEILNLESQRDFSPSLADVGWTKTAGNHGAALSLWENKYQQLVSSGAALTEAEEMELQHVMSQLRFFRQSYDIFDFSKKTGAKLMAITRYNIRPEWKNKFVFYDIAKANKSGKPGDPSNYQYADNLTNYSSQKDGQDPNMKQNEDGTWYSRIGDNQVPVKTEEFTVTTEEGDVIIFKARTSLDGKITWTKKGENDAIFVPATVGMIGVTSAREGLEVFEKAGDTVEVGEVGDYKGVMNPKMWDKLTQKQKEKLDPKRAKETATPTGRDESLEDIKLLLVDANNEPILVDGEFAYTNMTSSSLYTSNGTFKGKPTDLDKDGNLDAKQGLNEAQQAFIAQRMNILSDEQERFVRITKKSRGLVKRSDEGLQPGLGRLKIKGGNKTKLAKEEDLKNMPLNLALPAKGTKGADQKVNLFGFQVKSGFAYFGTNNNGNLGTNNLIPAIVSKLSENTVNNIYNLSRYFAENDKDGINIGGKGFTTILKDQLMYGERSKDRERQEFSIYMQEDTIFFGDKDQSISLEQLKDASKYEIEHQAYKDFLSTLYFNINSTLMNADKTARIEASKSGRKTGKFVKPEYKGFNEVIVNADLSTDVIEWDNYTHYLLSDANREVEDVPVKVDMPLGVNEHPGVIQSTIPQFVNVYLEHSSEAVTQEGLNNDTKDSNRFINKTEEDNVVETDTSEDVYEEKVVVNNKTGERRTVLIKVLSEKEKALVEGEVSEEAHEETPTDTLNDSPFSQSTDTDSDSPFFLATMETPSVLGLDLNAEMLWFNANMPKDSKGNPIFGIDLVKGLIDGKALGKFTKDGTILLSDLMSTPGILYHETWHAVTLRLISPQQRIAMYDEARGMRGSTKTYKGETKKMSELTDKEADEWLAEEFREYMLAGGSYNVGDRVQKSILQKIFDKIAEILNFFVGDTSQAQKLMAQITTGYFSNPNRDITIYDSKTEAYFEGTELTATMRNNVMEGMTVILFGKALKSNAFNLEDFVNPKKTVARNAAISSMYGAPETPGSIYSQIELYISRQISAVTTQEEKENLIKTMKAIRDNWEKLKGEHSQYLERFQIDITEEGEELEKIREQFGKPQNEIDPSTYLPKAVRVLLSTLPLTKNGKFIVNQSGLPKLVDFGSIMNFMYKEFANVNPLDFKQNLQRLVAKRPEVQLIINRLGLETEDISSKSADQMRLIVQAMMQFDQSNNTFYTQLITRDGGRRLINSNQSRVEDKVKLLWTNNFKENIQGNKSLGEDVNGELILNKKAKVKVGRKKKTFADWATDSKRTADETLIVLDQLGIVFTRPDLFVDLYNQDEVFRQTSSFIFQSVYNEPVSNIFKGDIQANLRTLIDLEVKFNPLTVDLQHRSPDGKTVHGVNLKTYADILVSSLSKIGPTGEKVVNTETVESLLKYDNLNGSYYLQNMLQDQAHPIELVVLQGIEQSFGRGKVLSKSTPVDIGVMMVNSVLSEGIVPILRTADKKTEFGIKYGKPSLAVSEGDMIVRLQGYLADELRVASKFNGKRKSKLHRVTQLKNKGGNLRFFQGLVPSINRATYGKLLSEDAIKEIVTRDSVTLELKQFLEAQVLNTLETLEGYNIATEGIDKNLLDKATMAALNIDSTPQQVIASQFTYEYMTGVNEQGKLLLGDFALYSDLFKRTSGISGTKSYPTSDPNILSWMNENMPNLLSSKEHSQDLRVAHRAAVKTEAPYLNQYMDTLELMGSTMEFKQNVNNVYSDMEEFDGGGFITLDAYRSLLARVGKWTPAQEDFYQKIASGEQVTAEDMAIIGPIKPQLFGPFVLDNVRLMTFHKFALFPLVPGLMTDKAFDEIHQDMVGNQVDYMIFESAAKVGGVTAGQEFVSEDNEEGYDPFYKEIATGYNMYKPMELDGMGQPLGLQELNFSDLGIQVEMAPKTSEEVSEGSQLRSLLPINIYDKGELSEDYSDFEELIDRYHDINNTLVQKDFDKLIKKLKLTKDTSGIYKLNSEDLEEFKTVLIEEFKKRDNPLHTIDALKQLLDSDTKFIEQLFEKNKIESLLYSIINNNVVKRKMPGGQFVLQASTGFENKIKAIKQKDFQLANEEGLDLHGEQLKPLKFYRKADPNNLGSETMAMQVYLPSRFKDKMGLTIEDINDPNLDPELLQLIGFRIPTEGLNSMDFIEVVGFLPKSFGDTVVVPSEIVGKAGSDYDIDKLSIYFPNSYRDGDVLRRVKFNPEKSVKQQSKKALQNELQTIIRDVLSHPASFDQLISPVGASTLKDVAKEIAILRDPSAFDIKGDKIKLPLHETLSLEKMINTSYRMFSGLGGIGIVATSSTQHAKGQRPGVDWNFEDHEDIEFNFAGEGFGLSKVYDVKGKDKISGTIGQYVTGYVDVTKEDFVFDINAGIENAPIHMLLVRSGVPLEEVAYFMSQPIIDGYVKAKELYQPMYSPRPLKTNDEIVQGLIKEYGGQSTTDAKFTVDTLKGMVGKKADELEGLQRRMQVQVLNDFLRYKELATDLLILKDATSIDTSNLNSSIAIRHAKQSINRLEQDGRFVNLDELLYGNTEGSSTIAAYTTLLNEIDGMFAEFKLGEYIADAKQFIDNKLFEATDKNAKAFKEDVIYKMKKFENFLAATIVQNTSYEYKKLHQRGKDLFIGKDSLPRRINNLKTIGKYVNNLLVQELTPILQVYTENSVEGTVDGLKLFSRKLQSYDVDLLADAFMELKEVNPVLAEELIIFSALQSGYDFSPSSFFQIIPGTEVLAVLSKYFKQNKTEDRTSNLINKGNMNSLWADFHKNYSDDTKVTPNVYRKSAKEKVSLNRIDSFVSITTKIGEETVGGKTNSIYATTLYENTGKADKHGLSLYSKTDKKGVKFSFIEATGSEVSSIVNRNLEKIAITATEEDAYVMEEGEILEGYSQKVNIGAEINSAIKDKTCK